MTNIVLEVRGGVVVEGYADDSNIKITVVDWDDYENGSVSSGVADVFCRWISSMPKETTELIEVPDLTKNIPFDN